MNLKSKVEKIIRILEKIYPEKWTKKEDPFHVLISTILSQRTRDENTEIASKNLFKKYKTPEEIAEANLLDIKKLIKPCGFYRQKAKNIKKLCKILIEKFDGKVPNNIEDLLSLPGVGRKTANCVLVYGYKIPAIPVDVHVHTIANRLGIVKTKTPEETEFALMKIVPKKYWIKINELFVNHGKYICKSKPLCEKCELKKICAFGMNK